MQSGDHVSNWAAAVVVFAIVGDGVGVADIVGVGVGVGVGEGDGDAVGLMLVHRSAVTFVNDTTSSACAIANTVSVF